VNGRSSVCAAGWEDADAEAEDGRGLDATGRGAADRAAPEEDDEEDAATGAVELAEALAPVGGAATGFTAGKAGGGSRSLTGGVLSN
jgi:hypothetical protein